MVKMWLQFFLNMVEFGMTVQQATEAANINSNQLWLSLGGSTMADRNRIEFDFVRFSREVIFDSLHWGNDKMDKLGSFVRADTNTILT